MDDIGRTGPIPHQSPLSRLEFPTNIKEYPQISVDKLLTTFLPKKGA